MKDIWRQFKQKRKYHCKLQMAKMRKFVSGGLFTLYFRINFTFEGMSLFLANNMQFYLDCHYII